MSAGQQDGEGPPQLLLDYESAVLTGMIQVIPLCHGYYGLGCACPCGACTAPQRAPMQCLACTPPCACVHRACVGALTACALLQGTRCRVPHAHTRSHARTHTRAQEDALCILASGLGWQRLVAVFARLHHYEQVRGAGGQLTTQCMHLRWQAEGCLCRARTVT